MKKLLLLLLSLAMIVSLCACGGDGATNSTPTETTTPTTTEPPTVKLNVGDTASTDLAEFTLESSQFTYYVSNVSTNYVEPTEEANTLFAASVGHCYVSLTFTITNKDRGGSVSYAGSFPEWSPNWTVSYGGNDYTVKGFDLNNNAGSSSISLSYSAIMDKDTGKMLGKHDSGNYLLSAGETVTLRTFGIIDTEPEALTDGYEFTVGVPNSKGAYEFFTYTVPAR